MRHATAGPVDGHGCGGKVPTGPERAASFPFSFWLPQLPPLTIHQCTGPAMPGSAQCTFSWTDDSIELQHTLYAVHDAMILEAMIPQGIILAG
eukprot:366558-Chlamydomonas_euryale.AAC.9